MQPVGRRVSVKCPTLMPGTSVSDPAAACACAGGDGAAGTVVKVAAAAAVLRNAGA